MDQISELALKTIQHYYCCFFDSPNLQIILLEDHSGMKNLKLEKEVPAAFIDKAIVGHLLY